MKVTIYTTPACPYCVMVKNLLNRWSVKFSEVDISKDKKAGEKMVKATGQMSVPVTEIDGQFVVGYDTEKLKKLCGVKA